MSTFQETEIEEFLPSTKDNNKQEEKVLKTSKYKNKKKTEIIVFPEITNKKSKNTGSAFGTRDVDEFKKSL